MKRQTALEMLVFAGLVLAGAGTRIWFRELPNFAPIAAMSLFAGYYFRSALVAACVAPAAMLVSDAFIGGYEWQMMLVVYGMLTLPVAFRGPLRRWLRIERGRLSGTLAASCGLFGSALVSSLLFFFATNFAWFPWTHMYDHTWSGLVHSYAAGLPFFKHTLLGDAFFAAILFGGYSFAVTLGWVRQSAAYQLPSSPSDMPCAQKSV